MWMKSWNPQAFTLPSGWVEWGLGCVSWFRQEIWHFHEAVKMDHGKSIHQFSWRYRNSHHVLTCSIIAIVEASPTCSMPASSWLYWQRFVDYPNFYYITTSSWQTAFHSWVYWSCVVIVLLTVALGEFGACHGHKWSVSTCHFWTKKTMQM
jgi:hypothetical protein